MTQPMMPLVFRSWEPRSSRWFSDKGILLIWMLFLKLFVFILLFWTSSNDDSLFLLLLFWTGTVVWEIKVTFPWKAYNCRFGLSIWKQELLLWGFRWSRGSEFDFFFRLWTFCEGWFWLLVSLLEKEVWERVFSVLRDSWLMGRERVEKWMNKDKTRDFLFQILINTDKNKL